MSKIKFYCVTNKKVNFLKTQGYNLAWVGKNEAPKNYITCDKDENIYHKEKFYSELTFHYWYWKNLLNLEHKDQWVGLCQKRRYWVNTKNTEKINKSNLNEYLIKETPQDWKNYDAIICKPIKVYGAKKTKIFKRGWRNIIKDPLVLFSEKKQNISLHFDMHHGYNNLKKAIQKLDNNNKKNFEFFVKNQNTFNPHIMFIAKPDIIEDWFKSLFVWLEKCEEEFKQEDLIGYDTGRLFAYLAERYLSYWFNQNLKCKEENWVQLENF